MYYYEKPYLRLTETPVYEVNGEKFMNKTLAENRKFELEKESCQGFIRKISEDYTLEEIMLLKNLFSKYEKPLKHMADILGSIEFVKMLAETFTDLEIDEKNLNEELNKE